MPYEVTETGWGEFEIVIKIYFHDPNERPVGVRRVKLVLYRVSGFFANFYFRLRR